MGTHKHPTEGGSGGKRGHSNMEHSGTTEEHKDHSRRRRRLEARRITDQARFEANAKPHPGPPPPADGNAI